MSPITPAKEDQIRERVIAAAQRLFQQYGLNKVTMEDVAKAIGKSKSSLYYYYTSKEEIFDAVLERETGDVLVRMRQAVDREKTAQAKLTAFCLTKIKAIRQKIMLYAIMSQELQHQPEFMLCARQRHEKQERELMLSLLNYGITTGEFSFLSEQNLDLFTFALLNSLEGLEEQAVLRNNFDLVESAVPLLTQVLARGLKA